MPAKNTVCRYAGSLETSYDNEELQPDWEIDPSTLEIGAKVGQGEFGAVHKVRCNFCRFARYNISRHRLVRGCIPRISHLPCAFGLAVAGLLRQQVSSWQLWLQARWHGATVAVKILRQADEAGLGDFRTELNVLQKVF